VVLPGQTPWHRRLAWRDAAGQTVLEHNSIAGLGHGVPIGAGAGVAGPHFLEVGIPSTAMIAQFFGIAPGPGGAGLGGFIRRLFGLR
jgi:poly(3-hydroxybutyrate) depolymerase